MSIKGQTPTALDVPACSVDFVNELIEHAGEIYKAWFAAYTGRIAAQQLTNDEIHDLHLRADPHAKRFLEMAIDWKAREYLRFLNSQNNPVTDAEATP